MIPVHVCNSSTEFLFLKIEGALERSYEFIMNSISPTGFQHSLNIFATIAGLPNCSATVATDDCNY